ncbi:crotonase [candidate division WOR-3 bacterium]|uniref:Crotonase n=1 Tax=candidate division WOR-3 bacterium TaxID=2052148 RepID=A0A660SIZ3_UNCW3|nr:MAG: crotonase [candidate division WOR-3 bacterium]
MVYNYLQIEKEGRVAVLTINRPDVLNAMDWKLVGELEAAVDELSQDKEIQVIIITGTGKAFVAGADIKAMAEMDSIEAREFARTGQRLTAKLENMEKVTIAAINGYAFGGGCELAMACDLRIASDKMKIGQPELKLGIIPGWAGTQRLSRLIGVAKAKELIFTGEPIDAEEALRIGLVNRVVPHDSLLEEAKKLARKILEVGPIALKLAKTVINRGIDANFTTASSYEAEAFGVAFATEEAREGMRAFIEKRKPNWTKEER